VVFKVTLQNYDSVTKSGTILRGAISKSYKQGCRAVSGRAEISNPARPARQPWLQEVGVDKSKLESKKSTCFMLVRYMTPHMCKMTPLMKKQIET